ncbi:uncharacterized protein KD926_000144 [Aspergillus affinis]|uniref:uncharacterized protein n=1 Tax=Aspergillus affinis TaxID=1070780 RepID=UPI0022FE90F7|nr:uncharacterized protein KD926_000144 [Aspergillus affinis]KAI9037658.1 hypothetical protein KD926_000144 [Aspergillus affinis]
MDCPEEPAHYIRHIHKTWSFICHNPEISGLVDGNTVKLLETLTPVATSDQSTIKRLAHNGEIFSSVDSLTVMEQIVPRLFQILALANKDPDIAAAKEFIKWCRPTDQHEANNYEAEKLLRYIAGKMGVIESPKDKRATPQFVGVVKVPKKLRCGLPDNRTYKNGRNHLFLDTIYDYNPPFGQYLTSSAEIALRFKSLTSSTLRLSTGGNKREQQLPLAKGAKTGPAEVESRVFKGAAVPERPLGADDEVPEGAVLAKGEINFLVAALLAPGHVQYGSHVKVFALSSLVPLVAAMPGRRQESASTGSFGVTAARSGSPIHFLPLTAAGSYIYLGGKSQTYIAEGVPLSKSTNDTILAGSRYLVFVFPGGQEIYVDACGALSFTTSHSGDIPEGSSEGPFKYIPGKNGGLGTWSYGSSFIACPTASNATTTPYSRRRIAAAAPK